MSFDCDPVVLVPQMIPISFRFQHKAENTRSCYMTRLLFICLPEAEPAVILLAIRKTRNMTNRWQLTNKYYHFQMLFFTILDQPPFVITPKKKAERGKQ